MPALPDAAAIVRVRVIGTVNGAPFNNIFHLQYDAAAPSVANLNTLCADVLTAWQTNFKSLCPSTVVLASADAQDLTGMRDQLERGFRRLTPEQRAVLVLHHYLGLADAEAAIVLDIAVGTFKSRLHRASAALRAALEADERTPTVAGEFIA